MYDDYALGILIDRLRNYPISNLSRNPDKASTATAILLSREWIEHMPDVVELWLSQPLRANEVLRKTGMKMRFSNW